MSNPTEKPNSPAKPDTAWYDRTGDNHPAQLEPCPTCNASPGAPCVSVVPAFGHGATGTPIRGLHAARVDEARKASESVSEQVFEALTAPLSQCERSLSMLLSTVGGAS